MSDEKREKPLSDYEQTVLRESIRDEMIRSTKLPFSIEGAYDDYDDYDEYEDYSDAEIAALRELEEDEHTSVIYLDDAASDLDTAKQIINAVIQASGDEPLSDEEFTNLLKKLIDPKG